MLYSKAKYKIVHLIVKEANRSLSEGAIANYYRESGWKVTNKYLNKLKAGGYSLSQEIVDLFDKYSDGYPDLVLTKEGKVCFVEIKLDQDALRPNQVKFNSELAEAGADITVAYFFNEQRLTEPFKALGKRKVKSLKAEVTSRCRKLESVRKRKNLKPWWIIGVLYEEFGNEILNKTITSTIANILQLNKGQVVWFVKEVLQKKEKELTV